MARISKEERRAAGQLARESSFGEYELELKPSKIPISFFVLRRISGIFSAPIPEKQFQISDEHIAEGS